MVNNVINGKRLILMLYENDYEKEKQNVIFCISMKYISLNITYIKSIHKYNQICNKMNRILFSILSIFK